MQTGKATLSQGPAAPPGRVSMYHKGPQAQLVPVVPSDQGGPDQEENPLVTKGRDAILLTIH